MTIFKGFETTDGIDEDAYRHEAYTITSSAEDMIGEDATRALLALKGGVNSMVNHGVMAKERAYHALQGVRQGRAYDGAPYDPREVLEEQLENLAELPAMATKLASRLGELMAELSYARDHVSEEEVRDYNHVLATCDVLGEVVEEFPGMAATLAKEIRDYATEYGVFE